MEYEDIQERLSVLRTVNMPLERDEGITSVLQNEIEKYNRHSERTSWRRHLGWIGSASAAAVVCAVVVGAVLYNQHPGVARPNFITATNGQRQAATTPIRYEQAQLTQVRRTAQAVGVKASIPYQGMLGDALRFVKNGGKGNLILDYRYFWVIESTTPIGQPNGITTQSSITVGGIAATYMAGAQNSFLSFQSGTTYIMVENLTPGNLISQQNMQAIGESFHEI